MGLDRIVMVNVGVLTGDIAHRLLVTMLLGIEDEEILALVAPRAERQCAVADAALECHVEARLVNAAQIVDGVAAAADHVHDLRGASLAGPDIVEGDLGDETRIVDAEHDRIQDRLVGVVERAIQEDRGIVPACRSPGAHARTRLSRVSRLRSIRFPRGKGGVA
jgi:hypothetical protein